MITISRFDFENERFLRLLNRQGDIPADVAMKVAAILEDVKTHGDDALFRYMKEFDGIDLHESGIVVSDAEYEEAKARVPKEFQESLRKACDNIFSYHQKQKARDYTVTYDDGVVLERKYTPLSKVGVTVPGQMAPLFSSLYMNVIPALVAGVKEIYVITKPVNGKIHDTILYTAHYLGVTAVYKISGAQGIAALGYGTNLVKKVDAIVGPGNNFTQMAKKLLYGQVKLDSLAGPSEIAIIADEEANPTFIAADLLSQAEHGTGYEASTVFCLSEKMAMRIKEEVKRLISENGLTAPIKSLENYGDLFVVDSLETATTALNRLAPEHAQILVQHPEEILPLITNAGAVFVGEYSPEPVGDYFCGSNHVLPTCGTARFSSGLSVADFTRGYSVIQYTKEALAKNGANIELLARTEGLSAHALSVAVRNNRLL
ncbi:MAG: histidinol dehydrogenase [Lachnospiraceae bacterium]|jgi:histidinol dehydrogenase|nr:histidinol dehydrogenase [Lachnospiraceae bacterium]